VAYGIKIDGNPITYSALSVLAKGTITSSFSLAKSNYPDVTEFKVAFIPIGVRSTATREVRPSSSQDSTRIYLTKPSNAAAHLYLVLGR
jgi:hypothetical protein